MFTARSKPDMTPAKISNMEQDPETEHSTSRRGFLASVGGTIVAGLSGGIDEQLLVSSTDNNSSNRKTKFSETTHNLMSDTVGYLALPGVSFTSLLVHLPSIFSIPNERTPIIIIDIHDYERFRGRILTEKGNQKVQHMGMVFDDLRRRGALKFIDYANFYPNVTQQQILIENRIMLETTDDYINRNAARGAANGWIEYGRGEYQEQFRTHLGENPDAFGDSRHKVDKQQEKMDQGLGDPIGWNENILNQYRAAIEVRREVDRHLDIDVPYIIGQGESSLIDIYDIDRDSRYAPASRFIEVNPGQTAQNRKMLEDIATMGQKIAGVQHTDWVILGPRLAFPQYNEIFDFNIDKISKQTQIELDTRTIIAQAKEALTVLNERVERPKAQIKAGADYMAEQYEQDSEKMLEKIDEAVALSNYSRDLRDLNDKAGISQAALFLAASVKRDPVRRYNEDEVYKRGVDIINQLVPPTVTNAEIEHFRDRGTFRRQGNASDDSGDWYQSSIRWR